tara:strand:+ start:344 stop:1543 length:1200 start_codon:yes stop_codon:yes gene_type:complete
MMKREFEIDFPGLPKSWKHMDCVPAKTVDCAVDLISDDGVLRIIFNTEQAKLLAEERAIVSLLEPRRFLTGDISPTQRVRLITEGVGRDEKVAYNIWTDIQRDKVTLVPKEVQLSIWLPPVKEVSDLAGWWLEQGQVGTEEFSVGYALSSFKAYLMGIGVDEKKASGRKGVDGMCRDFLAKYYWFEWCEIPEHLFSVRGLVKLEGGEVVGVSDVKRLPLYQVHRDRLIEKGVAFKSQSLPTHEWFGDLKSKVEASLEHQLSMKEQFAPLREHLKATFEIWKQQVQKQSRRKGGLAKEVHKKIRLLAKELADNGPPELREPNRRSLCAVPDELLMELLLGRILGLDKGVEYFIKKINSEEISGQTARRWSDLLQNHSLVISAITPIQHQLAETECDAEGE